MLFKPLQFGHICYSKLRDIIRHITASSVDQSKAPTPRRSRKTDAGLKITTVVVKSPQRAGAIYVTGGQGVVHEQLACHVQQGSAAFDDTWNGPAKLGLGQLIQNVENRNVLGVLFNLILPMPSSAVPPLA